MSNEKATFSPSYEPIPAGSIDWDSSSIPAGKPALGGPDLGPNASLLDYTVPAGDSMDELGLPTGPPMEVQEIVQLQARKNATGTVMHPQSTMIPVGGKER